MDEENKDLPRVGADGVMPAEELEEQTPAAETAELQDAAPEEEHEKKETKKDPQDHQRRTVLYGAAGAYLIYLAVQMIRDLIKQTPADWGGTEIAALVASVVFIAAGVLMIVRIALWFKQDMDEKKNHTTDGEN